MKTQEGKTKRLFDIITTCVVIIFLLFIYIKFVYR
jgi:hypothetical protein